MNDACTPPGSGTGLRTGTTGPIAVGVGLAADRVAAVLGSDEYGAAVEADRRQAAAFGATGVPFFVFDRKYGVSGAQPAEVFAQALRQAWSDSHS